jgi:hypothetical protein
VSVPEGSLEKIGEGTTNNRVSFRFKGTSLGAKAAYLEQVYEIRTGVSHCDYELERFLWSAYQVLTH